MDILCRVRCVGSICWSLPLKCGVSFNRTSYQKNFPIIGLVIFGGILIAQVVRYRHAGAAQRLGQIKWVIYGIILGIAPLLLFFILYLRFLNAGRV